MILSKSSIGISNIEPMNEFDAALHIRVSILLNLSKVAFTRFFKSSSLDISQVITNAFSLPTYSLISIAVLVQSSLLLDDMITFAP